MLFPTLSGEKLLPCFSLWAPHDSMRKSFGGSLSKELPKALKGEINLILLFVGIGELRTSLSIVDCDCGAALLLPCIDWWRRWVVGEFGVFGLSPEPLTTVFRATACLATAPTDPCFFFCGDIDVIDFLLLLLFIVLCSSPSSTPPFNSVSPNCDFASENLLW